MECSSCGNELPNGVRFCASCGARADRSGGSGKCPRCQAQAAASDRFCRACGSDVRYEQAQPTEKRQSTRRSAANRRATSDERTPRRPAVIVVPAVVVLVAVAAWLYTQTGTFSDPAGSPPGGSVAGGQAMGGPSPGAGSGAMNQTHQEIDALREELKANPNKPSALVRLGNICQDAAMYEQAIHYYTKFLSVDSTDADVRVDMATCYHELGQDDEAIRQVDKALTFKPAHKNALYNRGVISLSAGKPDDARKFWNRVIELYPESESAASAKENLRRL